MRPFNGKVRRTMFVAVAVFGLANLLFAVSTWFWLSFAALLVAGAADMVSVYIRGALVQFSHARPHAGPRERGQHAVHRLIQRTG